MDYLLNPYRLSALALIALCLAFLNFLRTKRREDALARFRKLVKSDTSARFLGLILICAAGLFAYLFVYQAYREALAHEKSLIFSPKAIALPVILLVLGVVFAILGSRADMLIPMTRYPQPVTALQVAFILLVIAAAVGSAIGFDRLLENMGYRQIR